MMKRIFRKKLSKTTLFAFATALFIVPAASARPVIDVGPSVTPRAIVVPSTNLTDGWYSAATQQTPLTDGWATAVIHQSPTTASLLTPRPYVFPTFKGDGWYSAALQQTRLDNQPPVTDGWMSAITSVSQPPVASTTTVASSTHDFPYRNVGLVLAFGLLLAALATWTVSRSRQERHVPVLQ